MQGIKLKILLIFLMLLPIPFSCKDYNECSDELYVEPYFSAQNLVFNHVDQYWINRKTKQIMFDVVSQDFDYTIYAGDSMALYFQVPNDELLFHSQIEMRKGFSFTQEAFAACVTKRSGWAGTRDLVDKIYISSNYPYNEAHGKDYDLSDIVEIFAYNNKDTGKEKWMPLNQYNKNSPYEAPKRFYLLMKSKPTMSKTQQFVVKYYMKTEPGMPSKYFIVTTPIFKIR